MSAIYTSYNTRLLQNESDAENKNFKKYGIREEIPIPKYFRSYKCLMLLCFAIVIYTILNSVGYHNQNFKDLPFTIEEKNNFAYLKDLQLHSNRTKHCGAYKCGYPLENDLILLLVRIRSDYRDNTNTHVEELENEYIALQILQEQNISCPLDYYSLKPTEIILNENDFEKLSWKLDGIYFVKKKDGFHLVGMVIQFIDGIHIHSDSKPPTLKLCEFYNFTTQTWPIGFVENFNYSYQPILKYSLEIPDFQFILNHTGFAIVLDVQYLPSIEKDMNHKCREEVLYETFMQFFETFWIPQTLSEFLTWSFHGLPFGPWWYVNQTNRTDKQKYWIFCESDASYTRSPSVCGNFRIKNGSYFLENVEYSVLAFDLAIVNAKNEFILSIALYLGTKNSIINLDFQLVKFTELKKKITGFVH